MELTGGDFGPAECPICGSIGARALMLDHIEAQHPNLRHHQIDMNNERRAELGIAAIRAAASVTNVWRVELADTAITDVLAYIAHACDLAGLNPREVFAAGLESYEGDFEDGPKAVKWFDGCQLTFAEMKVWGE